jgi:tetratricopeptide (TPR) repeat protein
MLSALACRAGSLFYLGDYQGVIAMWETIATRYDQERDRGAAGLHGVDPLTHGGAFAAFARWALGYPDQARGAQEYVIEHAVALGRPYNLAWGLIHCGYTLAEQGSSDGYRAHLDRAERIAREQGIDFMADVWLPAARLRLLCLEGDDTGVASIFPAVKQAWIRSGLMIGLPWITASPATALVRLGRPQEALSLLDESLAQIRTPGWEERSYLAEVLRVRAAALLALGRKSEAEVDLQASLEVAREQEAKSLELRAAMDYARFMHARGRTGEALTLLRPVYDWFTEGFDTRDLIEAKVLLDELGS